MPALRLALVNDSPNALQALRTLLESSPAQHQILWTAQHGRDAIAQCLLAPPDLILMDLVMPVMNGVEATKALQTCCPHPIPVLIVTAHLTSRARLVTAALANGATDAFELPLSPFPLSPSPPANPPNLPTPPAHPPAGQILLEYLQTWKPAPHSPTEALNWEKRGQGASPLRNATDSAQLSPRLRLGQVPPLILIGSSTGGPAALVAVLSRFPRNFPGAVIIVQHIDAKFAPGLAAWLETQISLPVALIQDGDRPQPSKVLLAGCDAHLILQANLKLYYTPDPQDYPYRPSVNLLFQSMARHWPHPGTALLLTGMGYDGADGLKSLRDRSWHTIAQSAASCTVYGMPKAAIDRDAAVQVLSPDAMASICLHRVMLQQP